VQHTVGLSFSAAPVANKDMNELVMMGDQCAIKRS